ncbi:MAG: rRNA pseudouridine synthase [Lentisphaeria bacterium]|nr:rRNA pseudouridine synthase [Lentisphaeria bacterium]
MDGMEGMSLTKFLGNASVCSRRAAAEWIASGRVTVNGTIPEQGGALRLSAADTVRVDGKVVELITRKYYVMLHKPRGYVCTLEDRHAAKKAVELIRGVPPGVRMVSAGRLDKDSEGLILFTNDGELVARLTHPRYEVEKSYYVSLTGELMKEEIALLTEQGIMDQGDLLRARRIRSLGNCRYEFVLSEGNKREIRRMAAYFDLDVRRLKRIAVGRLHLGSLECGCCRALHENELKLLFEKNSGIITGGGENGKIHRTFERSYGNQVGFRRYRSEQRRYGSTAYFSPGKQHTPLYRGGVSEPEDPVRFHRSRKKSGPDAERSSGRGSR